METKPDPKCEFDQGLKAIVHKFKMNATICECGEMVVEKMVFGKGRQSYASPKAKS